MPAVINNGTGGELNPGFDGSGGPVATAIATVRRTDITFSGGDNVLSAQVSYGWDQVAGEARVVCATPTGAVDDNCTLTFGCTPGNFSQRFSGTIVSIDTTLAPHSVSLLCKGPLYALEKFRNDVKTTDVDQTRPGLSFADLVGTATGTLKQLVAAVLAYVGAPALHASSDDPSHVYGTGAGSNGTVGATDEMTWGTHETASAYVHRFLEASAGYRLFDSSDGNVFLKQITAIPTGSPDFTLTLGQDIFGDSVHSTTSIGRQGAVIVTGYDDGSGPATSGVVGSGISAFQVTSNLIETDAFAAEIAAFWLPQVNRLQELVRLTTPRDDLFGPGQSHYIDAAGGLSVNDTMWLKSYTAEISNSGEMTQHPVYIAGTP